MINFVAYVIGILFVLVGVGFSIGLHEIGHLLPAKIFGARVPKYMIGFGPTLYSRKYGETEYGLKLLPLGGYISISGMMPPAKPGSKPGSRLANFVASARRNQQELDGQFDSKRAFYNLAIWKRIVVMLGGPVMNLVLGIFFTLVVVCGIGIFQTGTTVVNVASCVPALASATSCTATDAVGPAKAAGLMAGDKITKINGQDVSTFTSTQALLQGPKRGDSVRVTFIRKGRELTYAVTPVVAERAAFDPLTGASKLSKTGKQLFAKRGVLGLELNSVRAPISLGQGIQYSATEVVQTFGLVLQLPSQLSATLNETFSGAKRSANGPVSLVGVSNLAGSVAQSNKIDLLSKLATGFMLLASLNFALFVFNLIPLLPLDGGHVLSAIYEGIKRAAFKLVGKADPGPADTAKMVPFTMVMWVALMALSAVIIFNDIVNPVNLGF